MYNVGNEMQISTVCVDFISSFRLVLKVPLVLLLLYVTRQSCVLSTYIDYYNFYYPVFYAIMMKQGMQVLDRHILHCTKELKTVGMMKGVYVFNTRFC